MTIRTKTLLFIQLPIPRVRILREDHNLPVAALHLQAYLQQQELSKALQIQLLPSSLQNYASDETLLREIDRIAPDIVAFSLFCWNVERSLFLAGQIKKLKGEVSAPLILAGGPEVTPDNALLHDAVGLYVYGEGEYTLRSILKHILEQDDNLLPLHLPGTFYYREGERYLNPPQNRAIDINDTPSAYLQGLVPRHDWDEMFIESMRGCPFHCRFCYYNKRCGGIRFLAQHSVLELLQYAIDRDYREIFLLDPSFNIRPDLEELLGRMARINTPCQIKIATELRADMIDERLAQLLADAGIYEVELGLQSIHADTMRQIGRIQNLDKFLRGTRAMLERGIECKVDLIVGLPGDNLERFKQSARWLKQQGLDEYLQVFCLSVLPGTYFREHAEEFGLNYSLFPPYYLESSSDWSPADIQEAFSWTEDYFGIHFEADIDEELSLTAVLDGDLQEIITLDPALPFSPPPATAAVTKWLIGPVRASSDLKIHLPAIQNYCRKNLYGSYRFYLDLAEEIPLDALFGLYHALAPQDRQFVDRDFSILSVKNSPLFRYRLDMLIAQSRLPGFSQAYLDTLQQYFLLEIM
ncbi:MAG: B12-binding domain-containing radical SAM protein [bacterium]|nr:B12-binding domain-containing radical SAM protein [bacterium]